MIDDRSESSMFKSLSLKIDLNIHQFSIGDISSIGGEYQRGGIVREVKQSITMTFVSWICR